MIGALATATTGLHCADRSPRHCRDDCGYGLRRRRATGAIDLLAFATGYVTDDAAAPTSGATACTLWGWQHHGTALCTTGSVVAATGRVTGPTGCVPVVCTTGTFMLVAARLGVSQIPLFHVILIRDERFAEIYKRWLLSLHERAESARGAEMRGGYPGVSESSSGQEW